MLPPYSIGFTVRGSVRRDYHPGMTMHRTIARPATARRQPLAGDMAPSSGLSRRGRLVVIVGLSAWLWAGIATVGHFALG